MSGREYPDRPISGVGVVVLKDDHVLLIRRGREPRIGQWSIPGGKQELGEGWRETAAREVREETGIEIEVVGIVDVVDAIVRDGDPARPGTQGVTVPAANDDNPVPPGDRPVRYHYTLVDCAARWTGGEPVAGGDAAHAEWWPLARLDELALWTETVRIIREAADMAGSVPDRE
ncbi:MAG: NUDIX hydrolase [Alphaproteobacteria bacterium]|nr:NUDIX hydrolase [Alphaproteobacteria bacterium]